MTLSRALGFLRRGRMRINPRRLYVAYFLVLFGFLNSASAALQRAIYGRRIARVELAGAPLIVIGHWRSGTTLLHELFVLDGRFGYPTTLQVFAPEHFLVSRWLGWLIQRFLPGRRPMDDMAVGLHRPQEDEFALVLLGLPSPYHSLAFPNEPPFDRAYLDFEGVSPSDRARWKEGLLGFLRAVTYQSGRPLVLKSPAHLGRVRVLLEIFPTARFVHIVRDPREVQPSTVRLWLALRDHEGLQVPRHAHIEEEVFETFERLYASFERDRSLIPPGQLAEVRYEDLVADPVGEMRRLYRELGLGQFAAMEPAIRAYFHERRDYRRARYADDPELAAEIDRRWGRWMRRYGYGAGAGRPETLPEGMHPTGATPGA